MNEFALRDLIAQKIHQLKPGLTLLKKEQYIPNTHGTRSFIDLYARDELGRHVLIEVKARPDVSRTALHEVVKYVEGVKQYFGAKNSEIHVIIASTDWKELSAPFSRFSADAGFSVEGMQIHLLQGGAGFRAEPIPRQPATQGRMIAPWHSVYWYANEERLERGLEQIETAFEAKGIEDYVIALFRVSKPPSQEELLSAHRAGVSKILGVPESALAPLPEAMPLMREYAAYTAMQTLSRETCLRLISRDREQLAEVRKLLPGLEGEEALCYLHRSVEMMAPCPKPDYYEIGNPSKFGLFYRSGDFALCKIIRHGIFRRNALLTDRTICAELGGEDGVTGQKLKCTVSMCNSAHVNELKQTVSNALEGNPVWKAHILQILDELKIEFPTSEIELSLFNPETGVFTIYFVLSREQGSLYLPYYHILVRNPGDVRMYYGALAPAGSPLAFPEILKKYYYNSLDDLLFSLTWGGRAPQDSDIMEDLGAQYRSYRFDIRGGQPDNFSVFREGKWRACDVVSMFELFRRYAEKNEALVREIMSRISPWDNGASFGFSGR